MDFVLSNGNILAYREYGDVKGYPIIHAHGGPGSKLEGAIFDEGAKKWGVRFIVPDRPGYGHSTFQKKRRLTDYPLFIKELADKLRLKRFGVTGWSGGGSHVLAAAYGLPDRLDFAIALAGYTMMDFPGAHKLLPKGDRFAASLIRYPACFSLFFIFLRWMMKCLPEKSYHVLYESVSKKDQEILKDEKMKRMFLEEMQDALRQGSKGMALDARIEYAKEWGFKLEEIKTPLVVIQGSEDRLVPKVFAENICQRVPKSRLIILEGEGHMFPVTHQDLIFKIAKDYCSGT